MRKTILTLTVLLSLLHVQAVTLFGSEITYKPIYQDSSVYEITVVIYRDCRGIPFILPSNTVSIGCSTATGSYLSPTLYSIEDISNISNTVNPCNPVNTSAAAGIEKHTYKDTIDFSTAPFSAYANCSETRINLNICCRIGANNTGITGSHYNYASIFFGNFDENTSSIFQERPLHHLALNQPVRYVNTMRNDDEDSLSFELVNPMTSATTSATYSTGYQADLFVTPYFPGSLTYPYNNRTADPPIGFYFDSNTGDMSFTPTGPSEYSTSLMRVTEWRNDNGTMKKAGVIHRDMNHIVQTQPDNSQPILQAPFSTNLGIFKSCYGITDTLWITGLDEAFIPPPPTPATVPSDSLAFELLTNLPITLTTTSFSRDSTQTKSTLNGYITWNSDSFPSGTEEFHFSLKVLELSETLGYTYDSRRVTVKFFDEASVATSQDISACANVTHFVSQDLSNGTHATRKMNVYDSVGTELVAYTLSSADTAVAFNLHYPGTFIIRTESYFGASCSTIEIDTIEILPDMIFELPSESDVLACYTSEITLDVGDHWKTGIWETGDTSKTFVVDTAGLVSVSFIDQCYNSFPFAYDVKFRSYKTYLADTTICLGDDASFIIQPTSGIMATWPDGSHAFDFTTDQAGIMVLSTYDSLCSSTALDTFSVTLKPLPTVKIVEEDQGLCVGESITLHANYDPEYTYRWIHNSSDSASALVSFVGQTTVTATNICGSSMDTISLSRIKDPIANLGGDEMILCNGESATLRNTTQDNSYAYSWSNGSNADSLIVSTENEYTLYVTNQCGVDSSTISTVVLNTPQVDLGDDVQKGNQQLVLKNSLQDRRETYLWSDNSSLDSLIVTQSGTYTVAVTNPCSTTRDTVNVTITLGINTLAEVGIKAYPNPMSDLVIIDNERNLSGQIQLYNALGQLMMQQELHTGIQHLDVSTLVSGAYKLVIVSDQQTYATSMIKK